MAKNINQLIVSIPLEQGNVFRLLGNGMEWSVRQFQSLWNRAMSFDRVGIEKEYIRNVSIPLEQGNVFRLQQGVRALCGKASQSHFPTFSDV